jgi:hypothetical protein
MTESKYAASSLGAVDIASLQIERKDVAMSLDAIERKNVGAAGQGPAPPEPLVPSELAEAWMSYCDAEQQRQARLMGASADNTRAFLRDCGIHAGLPIVTWAPQLQNMLPNMVNADCRSKARAILAEWETYKDVCVGGNLEHLRVVSVANPAEYADEMMRLRIQDMATARLFMRVPSDILRERDFRFRHFALLAPPASRKRKAETDLKARQEEQMAIAASLDKWLDSVRQQATADALQFAHQMVENEWKELNHEPEALRNARPIAYEASEASVASASDEKMEDAAAAGHAEAAPAWGFLDRLLDAWAQHHATLRMDRLRRAHQRWMQRAQPWVRQSGQTRLADFHQQLSSSLEHKGSPRPHADDQRRLADAVQERTRTWTAWLEQMPPNQERQWQALRAEEHRRMELFVTSDVRLSTITKGYVAQEGCRPLTRHSAAPHSVPNGGSVSLEPPFEYKGVAGSPPAPFESIAPIRACNAPMTDSLSAWRAERARWADFLDREWIPTTMRAEQQLQAWHWTVPAHVDRHIQGACDLPDGIPTFAEWTAWLEHAAFALAWYTALL